MYVFNYYFRIFKPVSGLLLEHTLIIFFFNSQNLSESHYYGNPFFQLPRSLPKSLTRLPFYLYMYLNQLLSQFFMIFLPKCGAFYVVLEKGHCAGKKGMALEKKGMARRHVKTG